MHRPQCITLVVVGLLCLQVIYPIRVSAASSQAHAPILIDGNGGFTIANGVVGGNGTVSNPFLIQDWTLDVSTQSVINPFYPHAGITIQNTNAYFDIRNVSIIGGPNDWDGIDLTNVANGLVNNSTFRWLPSYYAAWAMLVQT
jgi:hypothetical protein